MIEKLDKALIKQLEILDKLSPGTDEYKDVYNCIQRLSSCRADEYRNQSELYNNDQRLEFDKEKLEFDKQRLEFEKSKHDDDVMIKLQEIEIDAKRQGINPNAILNAATMVLLTGGSWRFQKTGNILPPQLVKYADKIRI